MDNCFAEFLQKAGLYDSIQISKSNISELIDLLAGKIKISEYCTECNEMRVFSMVPIKFLFKIDEAKKEIRTLADELSRHQTLQKMTIPHPGEEDEREWYWTNWQTENATRIMSFPFVCAMDCNHHLDYIVRAEGNTMTKIGQFPSVADLSFPEIDEFKKDIEKESMREFRRAIGLHAQGIGVGSYVYLRRIFERTLDLAKHQAEGDVSVDLSNYDSLRVADRIRLLNGYLPEMISSSTAFYGIVSKGIHELSEEDCLKFFPVLQEAIVLILRQWAQKRKEQEAKKKLENSLSAIAAELLQ